MDQPFLSIVIPAYNEEKRIVPTLGKLLAYLRGRDFPAEVVVVDDGSSDATAALVRRHVGGEPPIHLISAPHRGKGHAVKTGMLAARGSYRFLCDADLAMPIEEIQRFLPPTLEGVHVAVGSREAPGARRYGEPRARHLMGRGFNLIARLLAVRSISDTQCGFKCFTAHAAEHLFTQQRLDGFGFDVEVLFIAQRSGLRVVEVPIDWYHQRESKVRPLRDTWAMLRDILVVRWNHVTRRYRMAVRPAPAGPDVQQAGAGQDRPKGLP